MAKSGKKHTCAIHHCQERIPSRLLMCYGHWQMVPGDIQTRVYRHYRAGQEKDGKLGNEYRQAMMDAIRSVRRVEASRVGELP